MTVSNHSTTHKKSSTKSHPATAETPEVSAAAPSASAAPSATSANGSPPASPPTPTSNAAAAKALAQLEEIESALGLDIVIPPNDKNQIRALNRVTDTALSLASQIVSSDPTQFAGFSALPAAVQQLQTMAPVGARASALATHVQKSLQNQRTPAAQQTLALYAVVKGLGRIKANETMREKIPQLKAELAPKRKDPKPKETQGDKTEKRLTKADAAKVAKAQKVLAAYGVASPENVASPASTAVAPSPASTPVATPPAAPPAQATAESAPAAASAPTGVATAPSTTPTSH